MFAPVAPAPAKHTSRLADPDMDMTECVGKLIVHALPPVVEEVEDDMDMDVEVEAATAGGAYAVVGATLRWPSMSTSHLRPAPAPGAVAQVICVCAAVSAQPAAVMDDALPSAP